MSQNNNQPKSFMHGAIILLIANAVVKVIGAIFKIPLARILGDEGMGYFSMSYQMYTWLFIVATAGLPVAISKMVSESNARGRHKEVNRIFAVSFRLLLVIGVAGFLILWFGADFFANTLLKNSGAAPGIKAVAPAMLFVAVMSAYRGYFQGLQNMVPTAFSEVAEALGKLVIGIVLANMMLPRGMESASAGAVFGVSCGGALGFVVLFVMYRKNRSGMDKTLLNTGESQSDSTLLKKLIIIAVPITLGASVFSLTSLIDTAMIMRRLQAGGFSETAANKLWGSYSGFAFPLFNLPPTLINAITISIVPAIAAAFAKKDYLTCSHTTCKSMKITVLFALPCSVGMSFLAEPILNLVYDEIHATQTLEILSLAIVFVSLVLVTNAILQATGNTMVPVKNMIIGGVLKVIINYFTVSHPEINIKGAPIGTTVCYIVILVLNLIDMKRRLKVSFPAGELLIKPLVAVAAMAAVLAVTAPLFANMGKLIATVAPIVTGGLCYLAVLIIIRAINEDDIAMLPKGDKLAKICKKLKIV